MPVRHKGRDDEVVILWVFVDDADGEVDGANPPIGGVCDHQLVWLTTRKGAARIARERNGQD